MYFLSNNCLPNYIFKCKTSHISETCYLQSLYSVLFLVSFSESTIQSLQHNKISLRYHRAVGSTQHVNVNIIYYIKEI